MKAVGYRGLTHRTTIIVAEEQHQADNFLKAWFKELNKEFEEWPKWFEQITLEIEE